MNLKSALQRIRAHGIELIPNGDKLKLKGNVGALSEQQMEWLRQHKAEILAELKAANSPIPVQRLAPLAKRYRVPLDDLLAWYADVLDEITTMPDDVLEWLVTDYARLRPWYKAGMPAKPMAGNIQ